MGCSNDLCSKKKHCSIRGVNPGGLGVATPQILGLGSWGSQDGSWGSWTGREILFYLIMCRKYIRKW